tara:strand:- start:27017 stop:28426 length:1410 start_codon:yes stop_codon:yes gene_type:complete
MSKGQQLLYALLRKNPNAFTEKVFKTLSPGTEYLDNWHIDAINYALLKCIEGYTRRQLIVQPPRTLKSICSSVAIVAWALGHNPSLSFISVSYSQDLATELAYKFRTIIESDWYRALFPKLKFKRITNTECITTLGGGRLATSIGGTLTGRGADIIIIDDPLKAEDALSEVARKNVITWYTNTLLSRFNQPSKGVLILVMQRLHEEDLAGEVAQDWQRLELPAIALEDQKIQISANEYHVWKKGELLHPERLSQVYLDRVKRDIGSLAFSAQYQQRPIPVEGNLVKRKWFQTFEETPSVEKRRIVQSWDVAGTINGNYSVCTTWCVYKNYYYLLDVWRDRVRYPDLKRNVIRLAKQFHANTLLIEKAGIGLSLYDELRQVSGIGAVIGISPKTDKVSRLEGVTSMIEAGQVWLPENAPWLDTYLHEMLGFPTAKYDDQVDSTSQFLEWIRKRGCYSNTVPAAPKLFILE